MAVDILDILKDRYAGEEPEPALDLNQMLASGAKIERAPVPEPSFMQYLTSDIKALPETTLTVGSGLVSEILAGWAGLGAGTALDLARFLAPDTMDVVGTAFPALGKDSMQFAEDVMDVVRKYGSWQPRSPRAQKQTEMIMWPFEKLREVSDTAGMGVEKGLVEIGVNPQLAAVIGASVAVAIEGGTLFLGPKLAKSPRLRRTASRLRRKVNRATRTGEWSEKSLLAAAKEYYAEVQNDPAMMADIERYLESAGKRLTPPGEVKPVAPSATPAAMSGVDEAIAAAIERRGGPIESFKLAGEEAAARVEELRRNPLPYVGDATEFMKRAEQALGHKFVPELSPFREKAAELNVRYRGPQEAVDGEVVHKFYDPQTGEYFTANTVESAGAELEAHRADVAKRLAKYEDVTHNSLMRKAQRWWETGEGDIQQIREEIRAFTYNNPSIKFETKGHEMDFIDRGQEALDIVDKMVEERGIAVEPTPTVEPVSQSVGAAKAEFNDGNISEPKAIKPEDRIAYMEEFSRKRSALKQEQIESAREENYDISNMLPDEAQDAYRSFQDYYERSMESSEPRSIGEIYNDMKTLFEGEEGGIYIGEEARTKLTNLTHEQRMALQRLVADAKRMVGDLSNYLREIGLDEKQVAFIRQQIDNIRKVEPETFGEVRQHWIDSRAIANGDKIIKQRKPGRGRQAPAIYASERQMLLDANELPKPINPKVGMKNPIRWLERIDPTDAGLKEVYYDYRQAEKNFRIEKKQKAAEVAAIRKGVSYKSRKRIMAYAIAQQERGLNILARQGVKVPTLTESEMAVYNNLRVRYEDFFERINTMREMIGKEPLKEVDNYFTFFRTFNVLERAGISFNPILDKAPVIEKAYTNYGSTPFRFGIERIKKGAMPIEMDAFKVFETYQETALRYLHLSPWIAKMNELINFALPDPQTGKLTWKLSRQKPNTHHALRTWVDHIAGKPAELSFGPKWDRAFTRLNRNLAYATLGANARSFGIQFAAYRNVPPAIGWKYAAEGIRMSLEDVFTGFKNRKFALKHSLVLDGRAFDIAFEDAMRFVRGGNLGGLQEFFGRASLKPLQWSDMETAIATWNGAYKLATDQGMNLRRAINFADDIVTRTQASALPGDLAPIQYSAAGKSLTLFQTFVINDWGFLTSDVLGIGNPKITSNIALKKVMSFVAATTLYNILFDVAGVQSPFPTPIRDVSESVSKGDPLHVTIRKVAFGLVDPVPVAGSARYGKGPGGAVLELGQEAVKSISGAPMAKPLPEVAGKLLGVPGTSQVGKMIRAKERGESTYGIVIGRYTPSERARRRRNPLGGLKGLEGLRGL